MKILPVLPKKQSVPVTSYEEIKADAEAMMELIDAGKFPGKHPEAFALSHVQVCEEPKRFFVVHQALVDKNVFKSRVIINPKILEKANKETVKEACMSFPFRDQVTHHRWTKLKVQYAVPGVAFDNLVEREVEGLAAVIFQHEIDHFNARTIYTK